MSQYMLSGYAWRVGTRLSADATAVGRQIDAIGGEQAPRDDIIRAGVVELGGSGELTKCFTQDRDEAARKRWEDEADLVMRSLVPVIVNTRTEEEQPIDQRVWIPTYVETNNPEDSGIYRRVPLEVAPRPTEAKPDKQMRAWVALMAWLDKYGDDPLFAPIVAAINGLRE